MIHAVPRKVLQKAAELGVHSDCVAAGPDGMCEPCWHLMVHAIDAHYASFGSVEAATEAFVVDLLAEA